MNIAEASAESTGLRGLGAEVRRQPIARSIRARSRTTTIAATMLAAGRIQIDSAMYRRTRCRWRQVIRAGLRPATIGDRGDSTRGLSWG